MSKERLYPQRLRDLALALAGVVLTVACVALFAAPPDDVIGKADFQGHPALVLSNDVLDLTVLPQGGAFASVVLKDDAGKINPLWDPIRGNREAGRTQGFDGITGHFVCVDGFGPASTEEREAGLPGHGEAHTLPWATKASGKQGRVATLVQAVQLPRAQELFTRSLKLVDGENVVYVHSELESMVAFDRPICWAEHATIGSPFLEAGVTVVDISKNRALTRPYREAQGRVPHRLPSEKEFEWPMAPTLDGRTADMRSAPNLPNSGDHTGHLLDASQPFAFVTALHPQKRLLLGYVIKPSENPWLQIWESYPPSGMMARGLEFGTQAFDVPRREVITQNSLFGQLLYRWLPARSKIESNYLFFWTRTPDGFLGVSAIDFSGGQLRIQDGRSGQTITLPASLPL